MADMVIILTGSRRGGLPSLSVVNTLEAEILPEQPSAGIVHPCVVPALFSSPKNSWPWPLTFASPQGRLPSPSSWPWALACQPAEREKHGGQQFCMVTYCSIAPVLAVLVMGLCLNGAGDRLHSFATDITPPGGRCPVFAGPAEYMKEVALGLLPVVVFSPLLPDLRPAPEKRRSSSVWGGVAYTHVGLGAVLTGVNVGFMPAGNYLGDAIAKLPYNLGLSPSVWWWATLYRGSEPAVHVLNKQVARGHRRRCAPAGHELELSVHRRGSPWARPSPGVLTGISILWYLLPAAAPLP